MMKQVMRFMPYALVLSAVVFFMSCSKDGPAGPAGPAGTNGTQGPQGPKGDPGDPGSANVIYSGWLDVRFQGAQTVTNPDGSVDTVVYAAALPVAKLDSAVLANALVNVYINLGTPSQQSIVLLPYTDEFGTLIRYVAATKSISLISNGNPSTQTTSTGKRYQYRYVIVPGGVAARSAGSLDWKNYSQVRQALNLQD